MTVYVDAVRHPYGRMIMCHMSADTADELHAMADAIGVAHRWFQKPPKASWEHYDISLSREADAIRRGAVLTDRFAPVEHLARLDIASGDRGRLVRGVRQMARVSESRARRAA